MNFTKLEEIKKLAIVAMFSDDTLMENLVLKGGNALDIIYRIANRSSMDIDFSMPKDLDLLSFFEKIKDNLIRTFKDRGFRVFDIKIKRKPQKEHPSTPAFWGGYCIDFKVVDSDLYNKLNENLDALRRQSIEVGANHKRILSIEISKHEYCDQKVKKEIEGFTIYVYSPEMIILEKLRSICQQMPDYKIQLTPTPRARDFFDIYIVDNEYRFDLLCEKNLELLKKIFDAKKVPLDLLKKIEQYKEFHEPDFISVVDTVKPDTTLHSYDFYFDYVIKLSEKLCQSLGVK